MKHYTDEQILEMYEKLPHDLKEAVFSAGMTETIKNIGGRYNLNIDKIGDLANETGMVMLGVTHPREFIPSLAKRLGIDTETAKKMAEEVNEQVFKRVRESLKSIHRIGDSKDPTKSDFVGVAEVSKEDVLKEIEKDDEVDEVPEVFMGHSKQEETVPLLDIKMKEEMHRMPMKESVHEITEIPKPVEKKYPSIDPYREPIE